MTVDSVTDETRLPPCGSCGEDLPPQSAALRVYVFDEMYELKDEIRSGTINRAVCPNCGYEGWLWPGFLVVDRKRSIGVFASLSTTDEDAKTRLDRVLMAARGLLDSTTHEALSKNIVRVGDYRHIYELLCLDTRAFQAQVAADDAYRSRIKIVDIDQRARQWVDDSVRIGSFALLATEAEAAFLAAVIRAIEAKSEDADLPAGAGEAMIKVRRAIEQQLRKIEPESAPPSRRSEPGLPSRAKAELTETQIREGIVFVPPKELLRRLRALGGKLASTLQRPGLPMVDGAEQQFQLALRILAGISSDEDPDGAPWPKDCENALKAAIEHAPDTQIVWEDRTLTVEDALRAGLSGRIELLGVVSEIALSHAQLGSDRGFWPHLSLLMSRLERSRPHAVTRFLAYALSAEYFAEKDPELHAIAASLSTLCVLAEEDAEAVQVPASIVTILAITWQRLADSLVMLGDSGSAALCLGLSAKIFRHAGRDDGVVRSQLSALRCTVAIADSTQIMESGRELLEFIRDRAEKASHGNWVGNEIECLCLLAEVARNARTGPPGILTITMEMKSKPEDGTPPDRADRPERKRVLLVDPPASGERTPFSEMVESGAVKDADAAPSAGTILVTEIKVDDDESYVARVDVSGVGWFNFLVEASRLAELHKLERRWWNVRGQIVEFSQTFNHPGITVYFNESMHHIAEKLEFLNVPVDAIVAMLPLVATCVKGQKQREDFLRQAHVVALIDRGLDLVNRTRGELRAIGVDPTFGITFGELVETVGRYSDARTVYRNGVRESEERLVTTRNDDHRRALAGLRATGLYRMARATLKQYFRSGAEADLLAGLQMIESYRARSILNYPYREMGGKHESTPADRVSRLHSVDLDQLRSIVPARTAFLVFALLEETELNDGFWFSAIVEPESGNVRCARLLPFDEIYKPFQSTKDTFEKVRGSIVGLSNDDASVVVSEQNNVVLRALEELGDVLVPPTVVAELEALGVERVVVVPESYLFGAPIASLRILAGGQRQYFFELNGGISLSVIPSWTFLADARNEAGLQTAMHEASLILAQRSRWRPGLPPIFGVSARVREALERSSPVSRTDAKQFASSIGIKGASVADVLSMVRTSRMGVFFGHGEIDEQLGPLLIADNGPVSEYEVSAASRMGRFPCELLLVCACSGLSSHDEIGRRRRDVAGVHIALLRGGVRFIVGSAEPLLPMVAVRMLETFLKHLPGARNFDEAVLKTYRDIRDDPSTFSPVYWGNIIGYGDGGSHFVTEDSGHE